MIQALFLAAMMTGCGDKDDTSSAQSGACTLAESHSACPECDDGQVTCEYGSYSETANSCGDCQARSALYEGLCAAGVEDAAASIEAGVSCSAPILTE